MEIRYELYKYTEGWFRVQHAWFKTWSHISIVPIFIIQKQAKIMGEFQIPLSFLSFSVYFNSCIS
jgi:hypothetical protein